ncbi:hypothetical protein BH10CYA1_BH10CYA1_05120 [soil metagenome]
MDKLIGDCFSASRANQNEVLSKCQSEAFEALDRFQISGKQAATEMLNQNLSHLGTLSRFLPDGTIKVHDYLSMPGVKEVLGSENCKFLDKFESISKNGHHFTFVSKEGSHVPLNETIPGTGGFLKTSGVNFDRTFSFDCKDSYGQTKIDHIEGVKVGVTTQFGGHASAKITEIDIASGASGKPEATIKAVAPIVGPVTERVPFEIMPDGSIKLDKQFLSAKNQVRETNSKISGLANLISHIAMPPLAELVIFDHCFDH